MSELGDSGGGGEAEMERLITALSTAGTSKRELAERYGISESSVKRLIRQQHGASDPSRGLSQRLWRCRH